MINLATLLKQISTLLDEQKQPWALIGGLAVSIRTEPRFTRDIDLAIAVPDDHVAENLVFTLQQVAGFRTLATVEQEETHRLSTARLSPAGESSSGLMLDLLFASSGIETEICNNAERLQVFPDCTVPVAQLSHLIALKILARDDRTRPQDAADIQQLLKVATESDLHATLNAVQLIEKRGFNRTRNLVKRFMDAKQEFIR